MTRRETLLLLGAAAIADATTISQTDIFVSGAADYHTFRSPALIRSKKGSLLAFCEGRRGGRGDTGDIDIILRRGTDHGRTWSDPVTILDMGPDTLGNPCPVVERKTGTIFLLLTSNPGNVVERQIIDQSVPETRRVWVSSSADDGLTWSKPAEITASVKDPSWTWYATGPGVGIQLRGGRMVIPCDHAQAGTKAFHSHCIYSDDHGLTWQRGQRTSDKLNECQVAELRDGSLMLNMRSYHGKNRRAIARSRDGGTTWGEVGHDQTLIDSVCQASLIRAGNLLLFSNPASTKRENMTVRASRDDGKTWPLSLVLEKGPSAYSCLAPVSRNQFACLYERGAKAPYERISLALFNFGDFIRIPR
jgi:sialidase-1